MKIYILFVSLNNNIKEDSILSGDRKRNFELLTPKTYDYGS